MAAVLYYLDSHPVYDEHVLVDALSEKQAKQLLKKILKRSSRILRSTTAGRKRKKILKKVWKKLLEIIPMLNQLVVIL